MDVSGKIKFVRSQSHLHDNQVKLTVFSYKILEIKVLLKKLLNKFVT